MRCRGLWCGESLVSWSVEQFSAYVFAYLPFLVSKSRFALKVPHKLQEGGAHDSFPSSETFHETGWEGFRYHLSKESRDIGSMRT